MLLGEKKSVAKEGDKEETMSEGNVIDHFCAQRHREKQKKPWEEEYSSLSTWSRERLTRKKGPRLTGKN